MHGKQVIDIEIITDTEEVMSYEDIFYKTVYNVLLSRCIELS